MLTRRAVVFDLGPAFLSLVRLIGKVEGALELLQSLAVVAPFAAQDTGPGEAVLDDIFRRSHANCVSQLTVPWLVDAPATSGVRVSVPVVLSDGDHLSLAVSFVAGGGLPALAQLHDLLGTGGDAPACQPPQLGHSLGRDGEPDGQLPETPPPPVRPRPAGGRPCWRLWADDGYGEPVRVHLHGHRGH